MLISKDYTWILFRNHYKLFQLTIKSVNKYPVIRIHNTPLIINPFIKQLTFDSIAYPFYFANFPRFSLKF